MSKTRSHHIIEKSIIVVFLYFFSLIFISPIFAAERSVILFGLKWEDSEEIVHEKIQQLGLICRHRSEKTRPGGLPITSSSLYEGEILGFDGFLSANFQDDKLVRVFVSSIFGKPVSPTFFDDLASTLREKYGAPNDLMLDTHVSWRLKNIDARIIVSKTDDEEGFCSINLSYDRLSWIDKHLRSQREERQRQREEFKKEIRKQL